MTAAKKKPVRKSKATLPTRTFTRKEFAAAVNECFTSQFNAGGLKRVGVKASPTGHDLIATDGWLDVSRFGEELGRALGFTLED